MCRICRSDALEASTDGNRTVEESTTELSSPPTDDGANTELGVVPEANESDLRDVEDANRRKFLKATGTATGVAAAGGGLLGASGTAAAAYECGVADYWDKSPNQSDWRSDSEIDWIVVHITDCTYQTAIDTFNDPDADVSAHYVISNYEWSAGAPGEVTQMVEHNYKAWHAGPGNYPSIGIEHEMGYSDASWNDAGVNRYINEACYDSAADIIACCVEKYDIPMEFYPQGSGVCMQNDDGGIIGHQDVTDQYCNDYTSKSCPTDVYDFDKLEAKVRDRLEDGGGGGGDSSYDWTTHSRGETSEAVYTIQYLLEEHGHDLQYHDGIYGEEVENNVIWFQDARGLTVDGIVGPETWEELQVYVWGPDDDPWWATYAAQHHLRYDQGYDIAVDGYYGSETEWAIEDFQSYAGITVDGVVGPETWKALLNL